MAIVRSRANAMDEYLPLACDPCRYTGKTVTATKYCEECQGHLCTSCSSSHLIGPNTNGHHVTYITSRQTGSDVKDDGKATINGVSKKCKAHRKAAVSFCVIHKDVCCRTCIEVAHKTCKLKVGCKLKVLSDEAHNSHVYRRGTVEIRNLETNIKRLQERFETVRREKQTNLHALDQQNDNYSNAVKAYRRNLNALLDKLQQNLLRKKDRHYENKVDEIKTCLTTCQSSIGVLGDALNKLELAFRNTDEQQVTVATRKMDAVLKRCEATFEQVEKLPRHYGFHFQAEIHLEKYIKGVTELGIIKEDYVESNARLSPRKNVANESFKTLTRQQKPSPKTSIVNYSTAQNELAKQPEAKQQTNTKHAWLFDDVIDATPIVVKEPPSERPPQNIATKVADTADVKVSILDSRPKSLGPGEVQAKPMKVLNKEQKEPNEIYSYVSSPRKVKLKTKPKQSCDELIVRLTSDTKMCSITGSAFLPDDKIVVADAANRNVKVFTADLKRFAHIDTISAPRDVAVVSMTEVVCTIPNDKTIQLLSVAKPMALKRTYRLDIECYGIDYHDGRLYVSSGWSTEREVQVLDLKGKVLKKIEFEDDVLKCPLYITVQATSRHVYVSDYESGVICFDEAGSLISRCNNEDTRGFMGISSSSDGSVYVSTLQPNGISKMVIYQSSVRPYLSDLDLFIALPNRGGQRPRAIAFSKKTENKMMITFVGQNVDAVDVYTM